MQCDVLTIKLAFSIAPIPGLNCASCAFPLRKALKAGAWPRKAAGPDARVPPWVPPWLRPEHQVGVRAPALEAEAAQSAHRPIGWCPSAFAGSDVVKAAW